MAEHRRKTLSRRIRLRRTVVCTVAGLLVIGGGAAGYAYWKLNGNIKSVDINGQLGTARPPASTNGSFNVLVLGSDSRNGKNGDLAGGQTDGTARSDTAMVVHVNQAHTRADVVSIPRDTLVARPACSAVGTGAAVPAAKGVMFNTAYEVGGPACAVKTTEQLTGMRMDHFVEIDFAGFADFVNAIGGVGVTTTVAIDDKDSGLHLAAGTHRLNGDQALAFVRTRHGVGDGSDLGRIELQKQMVKSMLGQVKSIGLASNPAKLWSVGDKLTKSITTDSDLASVSALVGLADVLKPIGPENLSMVTLPVVTAPSDLNRVIPAEPRAAELWRALAADRVVPESVLSSQPANPAEAAPSATAKPTRSGAAGATSR
ncbi:MULTISPECIES: LCP family protein [unclassified Kitasatospora]|uniref:LCP family protein n=1 Tax=unclassified Kitasatospora TaxID=2633591 RepID=UPI0007111DC2|nr:MULTISPECIES: LCP family protein [unclassified Kitasatospora]KQV23727.1 transcriptional regulator [Kitasatospora sp. Root107]KRB67560.1 transcriptional regulator [Kitasatospora sp. Root187]